jgi:hypothetical protein
MLFYQVKYFSINVAIFAEPLRLGIFDGLAV